MKSLTYIKLIKDFDAFVEMHTWIIIFLIQSTDRSKIRNLEYKTNWIIPRINNK